MIRAVVWNEFVHERENEAVRAIYPEGIHAAIATALDADDGIQPSTATLDQPEHGLPASRLKDTDVLLWWGHKAHKAVEDPIVDRVVQRVHEGMGLIVLHSGHFSKPFIRLMGTPCSLRWREAGERERVWVVNRSHPITQRIGDRLELPSEEMYGEPFLVPEPLETVLISWFEGGEVFRSGLTYQRGAGRIFYFRPGHETYPTYHDATVQQILRNAVRWAYNPAAAWHDVAEAPNVPHDRAPEKITPKGPSLHKAGEEGYR
jgi:trehalose utilization protein